MNRRPKFPFELAQFRIIQAKRLFYRAPDGSFRLQSQFNRLGRRAAKDQRIHRVAIQAKTLAQALARTRVIGADDHPANIKENSSNGSHLSKYIIPHPTL